jgi:hypothetical protein
MTAMRRIPFYLMLVLSIHTQLISAQNLKVCDSLILDSEHQDTTESIIWGWDNDYLYQSKDSGATWDSITKFSNFFHDTYKEDRRRPFNALNDSINSLYYDEKMMRLQFNSYTKQVSPLQLAGLFNDFLKDKITKVTFEKSIQYCGGSEKWVVNYQWNNKKHFKSRFIEYNDFDSKERKKYYPRRFRYATIDSLLQQLNRQPEKLITWSDLGIKKSDTRKYLNHLKKLHYDYPSHNSEYELLFEEDKGLDTAFFRSFAYRNDFSDTLLTEIFSRCRNIASISSGCRINMDIKNKQGETITIQASYYGCRPQPDNLIWVIKYKNWEFRTADINIYKFMSALVPKSFWRYKNRPKWQTYLEIAEYLYPKRPLKD